MSRKLADTPYLILSTAPSKKEANELSQKLLEKKLVACVNVLYPATSFFWWKGEAQKVREAVLIIKTMASRVQQVERFILQHHSYEVPEIIGWPIVWGSKSYLDWVKKSTRKA